MDIEIGLGGGYTALLSEADIQLVLNARPAWRIAAHGYVRQSVGHGNRYLHRAVVERMVGRALTRADIVDHINGDRTDNRRENLRLASVSENARNWHTEVRGAVPYIGVARVALSVNYRAYINSAKYGHRHLGMFATAEEAAQAYNDALDELGDATARRNHLPAGIVPHPIGRKRSATPGVRKHLHCWTARAKINGKEYHIGSFGSEAEAVAAREAFVAASKRD